MALLLSSSACLRCCLVMTRSAPVLLSASSSAAFCRASWPDTSGYAPNPKNDHVPLGFLYLSCHDLLPSGLTRKYKPLPSGSRYSFASGSSVASVVSDMGRFLIWVRFMALYPASSVNVAGYTVGYTVASTVRWRMSGYTGIKKGLNPYGLSLPFPYGVI